MRVWLTAHQKEILLFLIVFLISAASFAVGYLVANRISHAPIIIEQRASN